MKGFRKLGELLFSQGLTARLGLGTRMTAGGDTTPPSVSTFTVANPSTALAIPIAAFTASEAGVYFIITENSTPPAVDAVGWNLTAPATYTVSANGSYTLYPWVKDVAGNVSAVYGSPATVLVFAVTDANTLAEWWAGKDVYADAALTTAASADGVVKGWKTQVGAVHVLQSGLDSISPTYRASVAAFGNRPALEFSGDDYLVATVAAGLVAGRSTYTVYVVMLTASANTSRACYSESSVTSDTPYLMTAINDAAAAALGWRHRSDASVQPTLRATGTGVNNGNAKLITARRISATSWSLRLNGTELATDTDNVGATTVTRVSIGALVRAAIDSYITGKIAFVMLSGADDYATKEGLIAAHYGISI